MYIYIYAGVADFGNIGIMATLRPITNETIAFPFSGAYDSAFTHVSEISVPGYYAVNISDNLILAELTSPSSHTGFHRYTFYPDTHTHTHTQERQGERER